MLANRRILIEGFERVLDLCEVVDLAGFAFLIQVTEELIFINLHNARCSTESMSQSESRIVK